ncbi:MAG: DEAD/DEAH box helicase [Dehalobacter sp.]|nr:DEAD/DEAH box helicase [Dehalobacter sp.]
MNQACVILSLIRPGTPSERGYLAALRLGKGVFPKYLVFSFQGEGEAPSRMEQHKKSLEDFTHDALIFVYEHKKILPDLKKYFEINLNQNVIEVQELAAVFFPAVSQQSLEEITDKLKTKKHYMFISTAQKRVRLTHDLLLQCWEKGLKADLGFLSKLEEYTKGLSCQPVLTELKKEIVRTYPDRPIRTAPYQGETTQNLFSPGTDDLAEIPDSPAWAVQCFGQDGLLASNIPGFENREIQTVMAAEILKGFTEATDVVIEAGTGTGKTLAYLIPALWWSKRHQQKVIVATHTITLQEQLFSKDLPLLQKILPFPFETALLKGKSNYLCLKCLYQESLFTDDTTHDEQLRQAAFFSWASETKTGDFGELPNNQSFVPTYRKFGADNPACQPGECSFTSRCYLYNARKRAEAADVLVINHSLLLADIKTNYKILPEYSNLIIDEAHNIYQTALKQLGFEICLEQMLRLTDSIYGGKGNLFAYLKRNHAVWAEVFPAFNWTYFKSNLEEIPDRCRAAADQAQELFSMLQSVLGRQFSLRLDPEKVGEDILQMILLASENLIIRFKGIVEVLDRINAFLALESEQLEETRYEISRIKSDIAQIVDGFGKIVSKGEEERVTYLEKSNTVYLKNTLINVAPVLNKKIFSKNNCTILTSATLSVGEDFTYLTRDIGVEDYISLKLDSPFDYEKQMVFCVVNDLSVNLPEDRLAEKTASFIGRIAEEMNGGTLVLFTSHRYLQRVYHLLGDEECCQYLNVLAQGIDGTREDLLQEFMQNNSSVLLGTNSFWEGIDLPGDMLRCVIMVRLPFWPPDTPILEAKARLLESQGLDPFYALNLPEAIIRFKQGFGRLIRTREDKGVVIVLDDRIIKKRYGRYFLQALPITSFYQGSSERVLQKVSSVQVPVIGNSRA